MSLWAKLIQTLRTQRPRDTEARRQKRRFALHSDRLAVVPPPIVTVSLFGFEKSERLWAFAQMGFARPAIAIARGLRFWKLLGSGHGGGFSLRPNWNRYGLLAVWESADAADAFHAGSAVLQDYRAHAAETWTVRLAPTSAHGMWSGTNPFTPVERATNDAPSDAPVAVLTRATLRLSRARAFWSAVPATGEALNSAEGLIKSIGVGEAPFIRQATLSFWRSEADVRAFAYDSSPHREVVRRTRDEGWYAEELFARFRPIASEGTWDGRDPLEGLL